MPPKGSKKGHIAPVKFKAFFDAFEKIVLEKDIVKTDKGVQQIDNNNAVIFTDLELVQMTNEKLKPDQRITTRTFEGWKQSFQDGELEPSIEDRFFRVYQTALRDCKKRLFNALVMETHSWQRFAWIMERKFSSTWGKKDKDDDVKELPQTIQIVKNYDKKQLKK